MEKVTVYIPADADSGGKVFCPPEEFDALEDKTGAWTVCPGDVIGKGAGPLEAGGSPLRALDGKGGGYAVVTVTFHDAPGELTHWEVKAQ